MEFKIIPNSGRLMASKTKKNENSPDYWGEVFIDANSLSVENGVAKLRLSGWKKISKNGSVYLSLALQNPDDGMSAQKSRQTVKSPSLNNMEDDLPF